jgi:hypothetical protein
VLRSGGVLLAAGISRFASTFDGVRLGLIADPTFEGIVEGDLRDGVHRNLDPHGRPEWFTLSYFHRPEELHDELRSAGLMDIQVLAIEGPGSFQNLAALLDEETSRTAVLRAIRRVETEPTLLGASAPTSWPSATLRSGHIQLDRSSGRPVAGRRNRQPEGGRLARTRSSSPACSAASRS